MLAEFFDWLDNRTVQPTAEIVELYDKVCTIERGIQNALARMSVISEKKRDMERISTNMSKSTQLMMTYNEFETIMNRPVKAQATTSTHNTLCSRPDCYSNCHVNCSLSFSLDPEIFEGCSIMKDGYCKKCKHSAIDHRHFNSLWEDTNDTQVVVDEDAKQKFQAASRDKTRYQGALKEVEMSIKVLDVQIETLKVDIGRLCHSYQSLSLSGSFAGQISKLIRLFELTAEAQQANGADSQTIAMMTKSIEMMRLKQKLVDEADAAAEIFKVKQPHAVSKHGTVRKHI